MSWVEAAQGLLGEGSGLVQRWKRLAQLQGRGKGRLEMLARDQSSAEVKAQMRGSHLSLLQAELQQWFHLGWLHSAGLLSPSGPNPEFLPSLGWGLFCQLQ